MSALIEKCVHSGPCSDVDADVQMVVDAGEGQRARGQDDGIHLPSLVVVGPATLQVLSNA